MDYGPDIIILLLENIKKLSSTTIVIMITAYAAMEDAIGALKSGASDYLLKPILFEDLLHRIEHLGNK